MRWFLIIDGDDSPSRTRGVHKVPMMSETNEEHDGVAADAKTMVPIESTEGEAQPAAGNEAVRISRESVTQKSMEILQSMIEDQSSYNESDTMPKTWISRPRGPFTECG